MNAVQLVCTLRDLHVILTPRGNRLRVDAPAGVITDEIRQDLRRHKPALLDLVEAYEERTALMEYCGGLPRAEAEARAWECVVTDSLEEKTCV